MTTVSSVFAFLRSVRFVHAPKTRKRAQLAAVLVRHEVVGIVGACAGVLEAAENLAGQQPAGDDAVGAVLVARDPLQDRVDVVLVNGVLLPFGRRIGGLRIDRCVFFGSKVVRNDSTWL